MYHKPDRPVSAVQIAMVLPGVLMILFVWGLFLVQGDSSREEALQARLAENRNLALIISESLKQMTDRAGAMASLIGDGNQTGAQEPDRLLGLLAEDPVFNRLGIYDPNGRLVYATHPASARQDIGPWLEGLQPHLADSGFVPVLPPRYPANGKTTSATAQPVWRLPFLIPVGFPADDRVLRWILVELDVGYVAGLLQHVALGTGGFIQVLDANGDEWLRADSSGVVVGGPRISGSGMMSDERVGTGATTLTLDGESYQYVYASRSNHGFLIGVAQPQQTILGPLERSRGWQLLVNTIITLLIAGSIVWLVRVLKQQQSALQALQASEQENQNLIERLAGEHARSSRAAAIDHLSGLYNRRQFLEVAGETLAAQRRARHMSALLFIDLDRFKSINDSLGHHVGDQLLQAVAGRIQRMLGERDVAARFGGDEFVILLTGNRSEAGIEQWASDLVQHLSSVYQLDGTELNNSPSVGIAISPRDGQSIDELIRSADAAMYSAKEAGRGQYRFFDQSLNLNKDVEEFHLEQAFAAALKNREFVLHYQPQVCLNTMRVTGYETLVRWQHPEFGLVYPDRFIPVAEKTGFVIPMGLEVIRLACAQLVQWRLDQVPVKTLAVNVSPIQLGRSEFCEQVRALVDEHGLEPGQLELEITETAILNDQAMANLHCLKEAGIRLSLDDFGTGYSGLAHLEAVPVDKLKIDRSLIASICNSHDDSPVVSSTIILAKRMKLQVVAEGVETPEQLVHLKVAGCDVAQGYHLGRPMPAGDVPEFIRNFHRLQESA